MSDIYTDIQSWILENCFTKNGSLNNYVTKDYWWENRNFLEQKKTILNLTDDLNTLNMTQKIYHVIKGTNQKPKCDVCTNETTFLNYHDGYRTCCSIQCSGKSKLRLEKIVKNTDREKAILSHKKICLEKYGVEYWVQTEQHKQKSKETKFKRYGNEYYNASDRLIKCKEILDLDYIANEHYVNKRSYIDIAKDYDNRYINARYIHKQMSAAGYRGQRAKGFFSSYETDITNHIKNNTKFTIHNNDRLTVKNTEIDVFVVEKNFGIEINGLHWHEDQKKAKYHLLSKMNKLNAAYIRVVNIWDSEYIHKYDIVLSIINNILQINQTKIYARNCIVKQLTSTEYKLFLDNNHIQGAVNSTIRYGLFYDDKLISVMGFGKSRFKSGDIELQRYCNLLNTNVVGGASKLFKCVVNKHHLTKIISYCDLRWFTGNIYKTLGFEYSHQTNPNYYYFKDGGKNQKLESRIKYQKHKLKNILPIFDETKTEYENMIANNYKRVFDCGNLVFVYSAK
jgi:hypothetical protein